MLKIGEFSRLARVSVKTLRYYADLGLLKPAYVDRYSGYRYYSLEQLPRLNRILALKELGFSLVQNRADGTGRPGRRRTPAAHAAEARRAAAAGAGRTGPPGTRRGAPAGRSSWKAGCPLRGTRQDSAAAARSSASGTRSTGTVTSASCSGELWSFIGQEGVAASSGPPMAIYHDAEYRDQGADVEVAVPLAAEPARRRLKGRRRVTVHPLPPVDAASAGLHRRLRRHRERLQRAAWVGRKSHGYRGAGPNRELYLQGPGPGVEPSRYVTEVQFPVERIAAKRPQLREGVKMEPRIVDERSLYRRRHPVQGTDQQRPV